jgi:hypothetical protein
MTIYFYSGFTSLAAALNRTYKTDVSAASDKGAFPCTEALSLIPACTYFNKNDLHGLAQTFKILNINPFGKSKTIINFVFVCIRASWFFILPVRLRD